jgi:hypothetical protein
MLKQLTIMGTADCQGTLRRQGRQRTVARTRNAVKKAGWRQAGKSGERRRPCRFLLVPKPLLRKVFVWAVREPPIQRFHSLRVGHRPMQDGYGNVRFRMRKTDPTCLRFIQGTRLGCPGKGRKACAGPPYISVLSRYTRTGRVESRTRLRASSLIIFRYLGRLCP